MVICDKIFYDYKEFESMKIKEINVNYIINIGYYNNIDNYDY